MRRLRRVACATFIALLAFATPASAECAWVLWYFEAPFGWSPVLATVTKTECDQRAKDMFAQLRMAPVSLGPERPLLNYQCFPDTVEPRGPRGGTR